MQLDPLAMRPVMTSVPSNKRPQAGVAMCVFNGARYLPRQLASITDQSELPAEMAVVDDGSTDGSWELLQAWVRTAPFPVHLGQNPRRLGVLRNFERAVGLLHQDVILLADQDDIWLPGKVATLVDRFAEDPRLGLLHTDAELIDGDDQPLGRTLFETLGVTQDERALVAGGEAYKVYSRRNLVTGATCGFRRSLLAQARPFQDGFLHDEWVAFMASLVTGVAMLDTPTIRYRLHAANTVGVPVRTLGWEARHWGRAVVRPVGQLQRERADKLEAVLLRGRQHGASLPAIDYLVSAAAHARFRASLPRNPFLRLRGVVREATAGHYREWSTGPMSMARDLFNAR